jgi:hypothetical protein
MKTTGIHRFILGAFAAALVVLTTFIPAPANAAHEMIYAVDTGNNLINFWSDDPANVINSFGINGLQNAEEIRGIDFWNGTIYGLGSLSHLYAIDTAGNATLIGPLLGFSPALNGQTFGVDNGPAGFQTVSGLSGGQNLLVNRSTGLSTAQLALNYVAGDVYVGQAPRVDALAYDDVTGLWYAGDTLKNSFALFNPATGGLSTLNNVGNNMGIDASRFNGLDISPFSGIMYMGTPQASSDPQANLYTIDKLTGWATMVGQIGQPSDNYLVRGLTVIPEPGSVALVALGALGFLCARRRQP